MPRLTQSRAERITLPRTGQTLVWCSEIRGFGCRMNRRIAAQAASMSALAEAVRETLRRERAERERLERELADLRAEFAVAKRLDELGAKLERLEAAPRGLRAV